MRKNRIWTIALPATALLFAACKKKEDGPGPVESVIEAVDQAVDEVVTGGKALTAEERAAKLGMVGHLSKDTEYVLAVYDGLGMAKQLAALDVWGVVREVVKEEEGVDPQEELAEGGEMIGKLLGEEVFIAFGPGSAPQVDGLMQVQQRIGYHQMRVLSRTFAEGLVEGDLEGAMEGIGGEPAYLMELFKDVGRLMPVVEAAQVPPVLAGIKVSDQETREMAMQQVAEMFGMFGPQVEPVTINQGGAALSGIVFKGEMLAAGMEENRAEMDATVGAENSDRLISALKTKNVVVASGTLGDYLLFYVGPSAESCPLVDDVGESLAANDAISYVDGYADKPVYGFLYYDKGLLEAGNRGTLGPMAEGVRDGIQGVDGFGETRELVALLDLVAEREEALRGLYKPGDLGGILTVDGGARFEVFGGGEAGVLDYDAPHTLSSLGEGSEVLLFADWIPGEEYSERSGELVGALVETAYAFTAKVAGMDVADGDFEQFKGGFEMFDQIFRKDLVAAWDGLNTAEEGLGAERAVVVDLAGDFPPIPQVPQEIVEGARFVRASYVAPVTDRAKLGESWKTVDGSIRSLLKTMRDAGMGEVNMLTPTSSEKNDLITWYFDMLAFSDDVKPSVTLNDQWFVASTSKTQALDLVSKAGAAEAGGRKGAWVELDLDVLRKYAEDSLKLVNEHGDVVFAGNEGDLEDFRRELPRIQKGLKALEQFEAITLHDRMEGGRHRLSIHFKTR